MDSANRVSKEFCDGENGCFRVLLIVRYGIGEDDLGQAAVEDSVGCRVAHHRMGYECTY